MCDACVDVPAAAVWAQADCVSLAATHSCAVFVTAQDLSKGVRGLRATTADFPAPAAAPPRFRLRSPEQHGQEHQRDPGHQHEDTTEDAAWAAAALPPPGAAEAAYAAAAACREPLGPDLQPPAAADGEVCRARQRLVGVMCVQYPRPRLLHPAACAGHWALLDGEGRGSCEQQVQMQQEELQEIDTEQGCTCTWATGQRRIDGPAVGPDQI